MEAFTLKNKSLLRMLITPCRVSSAYDPKYCSGPHPAWKPINGLWDTGASCSMITSAIAKELGLEPIRKVTTHHAQGQTDSNLYYINVSLPNGIEVQNLPVTEGELSSFDMLIGMDIICMGDFSLTHKNGQTVFSFQIPSTHEYDFVSQIRNGVGLSAKQKKDRIKKKR